MEELLSYCGYLCDQCPGYYMNIKSDEDRKRVQADWLRYYDYESKLDDVDCRGCKAGLREGNPGCRIRPCAMPRGVSNCSECRDFICETLQKQMDAIEPIAEKHGDSMPADDYQRYISPFQSERRLKDLRSE